MRLYLSIIFLLITCVSFGSKTLEDVLVYNIILNTSKANVKTIDSLYIEVVKENIPLNLFLTEIFNLENKNKLKLNQNNTDKVLQFYLSKKCKKNYPSSNYHNLNNDQYIIGISRLYGYLYFFYPNINKKELESTFKSSLIKIQQKSTPKNYIEAIKNIALITKDMHTTIKNESQYLLPYSQYALPFNISRSNDSGHLLITKIHKSKNSLSLQIGDEIIKINNDSPSSYLNDLYSGKRPNNFTKWLNLDTSVNILTIKKNDGNIIDIKVNSKNFIKTKEWATNNFYSKQEIIYNASKYSYVNLNQDKYKTIKSQIKNIYEKDTVIIDVRGYPTNEYNDANKIIKLFKKDKFIYNHIKPSNRLFKDLEREKHISKYKKINYEGFIILIINSFTQSQSEFYAIDFFNNKNMLIIGDTSSNSIGVVDVTNELYLPGNYTFRTSLTRLDLKHKNYIPYVGLIPDIFLNEFLINNVRFNNYAKD